MQPSSPRIHSAAPAAAATLASPRTDARCGPARGRGEFFTGGRTDPGPRMVPHGEHVFSSPPPGMLSTPAGGDSVLEQLMRRAAGAAAGSAHPPALAADQWPTPGAAYSPLHSMPTPSAVAADVLVPVDELVAQLEAAKIEVERLEHLVEPTRWPFKAPSRPPLPSSAHSSASFATITSSSSEVTTHTPSPSGEADLGAAGGGKVKALDPTALPRRIAAAYAGRDGFPSGRGGGLSTHQGQ